MFFKTQIGLLLFLCIFNFINEAQNAQKIIEQSFEKNEYIANTALLHITVINGNKTRKMTVKSAQDGLDKVMLLITEPAKDKGTVYLFDGNNFFIYNPKINKVIKSSSALLGQKWQGTDLSNGDLLDKDEILNNYTHKIEGEEAIQNRTCYKIISLPSNDDAQWGKIIMWIDQKDLLILKQLYYDEDEYLVKTVIGENIKDFSGRKLPSKITVIPAGKKQRKTIMEIEKINFSPSLPKNFFTKENIKKGINLDFDI